MSTIFDILSPESRCAASIKILENAGEEGHRAHPLHLHVQKGVDGAIHLAQEGHQHGDIAHSEGGIVLHDEDAAHEVEQHGAHVGEGVDDDHEPAAGHALADIEVDHAAVGLFVAAVLIVLAAEELHQQLTADGQLLVASLRMEESDNAVRTSFSNSLLYGGSIKIISN